MASLAATLFQQALAGTYVAKSLAGKAFENTLAKAEFTPKHGKLGSASGEASDRSMEHDAPWLVNGAKYKVIEQENATSPHVTVGESDSRFHDPRFADAKVRSNKISPIAERVFREGHAIMTRKGMKPGMMDYAADADHPDHAAWEYSLGVQHYDPARRWNRMKVAKKGGAVTEGGHQIALHEGIAPALNQHVDEGPVSHMNDVIEGRSEQLYNPDMATKHVQDTAIKMVRASQRHAFWGRVLHHLASNPEERSPGAASLAAHPDISKFSTRSYVLFHAAKSPKASFAELNAKVKPLASDDVGADGKSRRPVLKIWQGAKFGHTNAADFLEHHLANLPVGDGRALKGTGSQVGIHHVTPAVRSAVEQHLNRFAPSHPSLAAPQSASAGMFNDAVEQLKSKLSPAPATANSPPPKAVKPPKTAPMPKGTKHS